MSGHPRDGGYPRVAKKVSVTGAGRLWECQNTEFVWELRKTGFCEGGCKQSCPLTRVRVTVSQSVQINVSLILC